MAFTDNFSLVLEVLDSPKASERAIDHNGQTSAKGLTFLHAESTQEVMLDMQHIFYLESSIVKHS